MGYVGFLEEGGLFSSVKVRPNNFPKFQPFPSGYSVVRGRDTHKREFCGNHYTKTLKEKVQKEPVITTKSEKNLFAKKEGTLLKLLIYIKIYIINVVYFNIFSNVRSVLPRVY